MTNYKEHEKIVLFTLVSANKPLTREDIVKETGIPRSTVYDTIRRLQYKVRITEKYKRGIYGRPKTLYVLDVA